MGLTVVRTVLDNIWKMTNLDDLCNVSLADGMTLFRLSGGINVADDLEEFDNLDIP